MSDKGPSKEASERLSLPALSIQPSTDLLRSGMALVADQLAATLPATIESAIEKLASRADAEPGAATARRFLFARRDSLNRDLPARIRSEQEAALTRLLGRDKPPPGSGKITAESLTLIDDDAVVTDDVASKVARKMHGTLELVLREVHLIVTHLAKRPSARLGDDPFAPEVFFKPLLELARELGLEPSGWVPLLTAFERPLAEELGRCYQRLLDHFRQRRVDAAEIRREIAAKQAIGKATLNPAATKTPSSAAQRLAWMDDVPRVNAIPSQGRGADSPQGPDTAAFGLSGFGDSVMGNPLARSFGGSAPSTPQKPPTPAEVRASLQSMVVRMSAGLHDAPVPASSLPPPGRPPSDLIEAIDEMQQLGAREAVQATATGVSGPAVGVAGADQGAWREVLLAKSSRTVDKLTIEIVGMLFDHVLQDSQVPAEIKAVLSRLQFPVLKVALTDADFFASSSHPARRLIDRLASTAVGWEPYGDENQRYKTEVERVVQQVLERFDEDLDTFETLLGEFDAFIGEMPARETDPMARAKRALEEAEKREVLVINTTIQVRRAFEHVELEPYLREFLVGPWVQALVGATLRDEQTPGFSKAFRQVIHDMVWSVQPKISGDERKRLVALIPVMTRVLRDGLNMIRMPEQEQQGFLKQLMASHAVAVRPVDQATYIKSKVSTGELRQKLEEMHITGTFPISSSGGGVKVSVGAVKRAAENHAAQVVMAEPIAGTTPLSYEQDAAYNDQIANWERGSWFNLYDGKETIKVRLRWISPLRTLFMFSASDDKSTRVLSPETIKSYLKQGWLKPLEAVPLTKRVVDRVVGELERSPQRVDELAGKLGATTVGKPAGNPA